MPSHTVQKMPPPCSITPNFFQLSSPESHRLIQSPDTPQQLFLLLHGYGSDADNLQPLGCTLAKNFPQAMVVSLAAPELADCGIGYQWFALKDISETNRCERVGAALSHLMRTIRHWQGLSQVAPAATALVGFSQGGLMCLAAATQTSMIAGRIIAHSAYFASLPSQHNSIPTEVTLHLIHGKQDSVITYQHAIEAAQALEAVGSDFTVDVLPNLGHEINNESTARVLQRLQSHIPKRLWAEALQAAADLKKTT
jgi:phospholipase/carboxylesterase